MYHDGSGKLYADILWAKDLNLHIEYIKNLNVYCPMMEKSLVDKDLAEIHGMDAQSVISAPHDLGRIKSLLNLPVHFIRIYKSLRKADVVHSGGAGWPFSLSYFVLVLRLFIRRKWIFVVESSPWLLSAREQSPMLKRFRNALNLFLVRQCARAADARIFTHDGYRRLLLVGNERALVAPANWIDEEFIISEETLQNLIKKSTDKRLLFAGRLTEVKGIKTVLNCIRILDSAGTIVRIDIMGEGELSNLCRSFASGEFNSVSVRLRAPVRYGKEFFAVLREYDGMIIANQQEEQPRIIFDAFSQGIPCIATSTNGNKQLIRDGKNGLLFPVDDAHDLANKIQYFISNPAKLAVMRDEARRSVVGRTHRRMHQEREVFLKETLGLRA